MNLTTQQFLADLQKNLEEWEPYTERLPAEKLQQVLNKATLSLTRALYDVVNELQREQE